MDKFPILFSGASIGRLKLPNRVIMSAMEPGLADGSGFISVEEASAHYALRARGGAGLIITGNVSVTENGRAAGVQAGLWCDDQTEGIARVVRAVHSAGGKLLVQLSHAGREVHPMLGWEAVAPSAVKCPVLRVTPRELTTAEVEELVNDFAAAAGRVARAGADGIEIHGAHGYLICQFLSPSTNKREDKYGGSNANRARFAIEIVQAVRAAIGEDRALVFKLSADEYTEDGIQPEQAVEYAGLLEEAGVDAIHVSACNYESAFYNLPNYYLEEACFVPLARRIKKEVSIPVITVGRIRRPSTAEQILGEGSADFVALGRSLLADPFLPAKARKGAVEQIRPCLSCNRCLDSLSRGPVVCTVNPDLRQDKWPLDRTEKTGKRALVAGAGPAGLSAAVKLADSGFEVIVLEKDEKPGGKLNIASMPPRKEAIGEFCDWLVRRSESAGVTLRLNEPFSLAALEEFRPDRVIIATGARHSSPPFRVFAGVKLVSVREAFIFPERLGDSVAILGAGGEGAELADYLSEGGQSVTLIEARRKIASDLIPSLRYFLVRRLEEKNVEMVTRFTVTEVGPGYVTGMRGKKVEDRLEGFSSVVLATGLQPNHTCADELKEATIRFRLAGDASSPRSILEAVAEGVNASEAGS